MSQHVDILDQSEPIKRSLVGSLVFHGLLIASFSGFAAWQQGTRIALGSDKGGKLGSVTVTPVGTIPMLTNNAPPNPVATDVHSQIPAPKEITKPAPKKALPPPKKIDPKALAMPGSYTKREYAQVNKYDAKQPRPENQLSNPAGRQLSSDMYAIQGSGRMGLGDNSPFGTQFGAYAAILRDLVASKWRTNDVSRTAGNPQVIVTFTLHRDGSVTNIHISQSSGIGALDRSGVRAIDDAKPFPRMPPQFPKDQTDIDFVFELKR